MGVEVLQDHWQVPDLPYVNELQVELESTGHRGHRE